MHTYIFADYCYMATDNCSMQSITAVLKCEYFYTNSLIENTTVILMRLTMPTLFEKYIY